MMPNWRTKKQLEKETAWEKVGQRRNDQTNPLDNFSGGKNDIHFGHLICLGNHIWVGATPLWSLTVYQAKTWLVCTQKEKKRQKKYARSFQPAQNNLTSSNFLYILSKPRLWISSCTGWYEMYRLSRNLVHSRYNSILVKIRQCTVIYRLFRLFPAITGASLPSYIGNLLWVYQSHVQIFSHIHALCSPQLYSLYLVIYSPAFLWNQGTINLSFQPIVNWHFYITIIVLRTQRGHFG